ncbi:oligosaccharide flippase family protein [Gleimia sp. 6138-11-ORH1]|uniref:lipopolysaccharide biosynthesis protein n=1 Tax=Gleimia sp. 6138-11-ORH1 TaxID=2973937 RepID=UPI0021685552|nr:oligosaccharide flippase family protein [Gleimia sp. 6138-11-ORH1]MCS4484027.1 oligosaccharide flippase family protein [Gleimia sp. 6138-11-ORH1]
MKIADLKAKIHALNQSSPFLKHILTLVSGTAGAQVVVFFMMMIITRLFTKETLGELGLYNSIVAAVVLIAAGRYDLAVMLEKDEADAKQVFKLGFSLVIGFSLTATAVAWLLQDTAREYYSEAVATWIPLVGVTVFFLAGATLLQFWYNRKSDYKTIAINRVQQQIGANGGQVLSGLAGQTGLFGLWVGQTLGQAFAFFNLGIRAKDLRTIDTSNAASLLSFAKKHWRMPILNGPNAFIDALRNLGIPILIGAVSLGSLGEYKVAEAVVMIPVGLFTGAISQVFFQKLSMVPRGEMVREISRAIKGAFLIGIIPFAGLYLIAPWLIPILFGVQFTQSGYFVQALIPWLFMTLMTSPISNMFVVTDSQSWLLGFAIIYTTVPLTWLYFSPLPLLPTVYILGAIMAVCLIGMLLLALLAARKYDRRKKTA